MVKPFDTILSCYINPHPWYNEKYGFMSEKRVI